MQVEVVSVQVEVVSMTFTVIVQVVPTITIEQSSVVLVALQVALGFGKILSALANSCAESRILFAIANCCLFC